MDSIIPWNICMKPAECIICSENKNIKILHFGRLNGVFYCNNKNCHKKIKKNIIKYINDTMNIPLYGLVDKKSGQYNLQLSFFRKSKNTIYKGQITIGVRNWFCIKKIKTPNDTQILTIDLEYNEKKNNEMYSRSVALDNIMFHNEDFYNKLSNCMNIFANKDIVISFEELNDNIRDIIYMYNLENLKKESSEFLF